MAAQPQVLIVGAGPTGLAAALFLSRSGVPMRIIDAGDEPTRSSKALGVNPRTLQLLEETGVTAAIEAEAQGMRALRLHRLGRPLATLTIDWAALGVDHRMVILPQARTEALLTEALAAFGVAPERTPKPPGSSPSSVDRIFAELHDGVASGALWARLIQLKDEFLKQNPSNRFQPRPAPAPPANRGTPPPPVPKHPRDNGFDQSASPDFLAQSAQVRPYDVEDDPEEIRGTGFSAAQLFFGMNDRQAFDQFVDPA